MTSSFNLFRLAAGAALTLALSGAIQPQGLDPDFLLSPPVDSWPQYHGDYSGMRHSALTQITPQNVSALALSWIFQTGQSDTIKCSPLLVNGVLYITVPDNVWAIDARSGRPLWHYTYPPNKGFHIGHRGVAMYKDWLYFTCLLYTSDAADEEDSVDLGGRRII